MRFLICRAVAIALLGAGALAASACESQSGGAATDDAASSSPSAGAGSASVAADTLVYDKERPYDLTGDGVPEIVHLHAVGSDWAALRVTLEIRARDSVLYADTFDTRGYGSPDSDSSVKPSEVADWVKQALDKNLADEAFTQKPDLQRAQVRTQYDVVKWATTRHTPLPSASEAQADSALRTLGTTPDEYARFEQDLLAHPMYKYYVGGLANIGVSWSSVLQRFVRTWDCC